MSTLVLDTLEDRVTAKQSSVSALGNQWEVVGTASPSAASGLEFYHDGWEGTGSTAFVDGWEYRITGALFGSTAGAYSTFKTYEPTVREATNDYTTITDGYGSSAQQGNGTQNALGILNSLSWGTDAAHTVQFDITFFNLGSTTYPLTCLSYGMTEINAGTAYAYSSATKTDDAGGNSETLASSKIDLLASGGTFSGDLVLWRRKAS